VKIKALSIENYRTLESVSLEFPHLYTAICGANDSGKTNIVRSIRRLVRGEEISRTFSFLDEEPVSFKDDYPKWKEPDGGARKIAFDLCLSLDKVRDVGFYQFVVKHLSLGAPGDALELSLHVVYSSETQVPEVRVSCQDKTHTGMTAQEVLSKLQSSRSIVFHNSTQPEGRMVVSRRSVAGHIREIAGQHEALVESMKKTVNKGLAKISKEQQSEFEGLLGRLSTKYKVGLTLPAFDFSYLPFSITLGDRDVEVPLDDWGSGTRNRTMILLALFRARQMADSEASAEKITPIIVIEEPESFLHPSAQAEFGRVLQDLAEEFGVQVLVTTHSPYLLSLKASSSNVLLTRRVESRQPRATEVVPADGDGWMAPFAQALGLEDKTFQPWRALFSGGQDSIILVEGESDKRYLEMLRGDEHGDNRLLFEGDIVPYEGTGALSNSVLLRFVQNRYRQIVVTYDLDAAGTVEKNLLALKFEKGKQFFSVGRDLPGKRNIEGLLPDRVVKAVYSANPEAVQAMMAGTSEEQKLARHSLKKALFEEFEKVAVPGDADFGHFYQLTRAMNTALVGKRAASSRRS
jgi:putative ATP-dependent endonuclease of OLD family